MMDVGAWDLVLGIWYLGFGALWSKRGLGAPGLRFLGILPPDPASTIWLIFNIKYFSLVAFY